MPEELIVYIGSSVENVNKITVISPDAGTTVIDTAADIEFYFIAADYLAFRPFKIEPKKV